MSKLQLILLGQFECLLSSGQRISLSMRKAEVLLAYLALAPGIRHPRERLINLLWSDRGEEQARNSLRQCLSAIRKSLGDGADLILQIDRTTVSLKPGLIDVDALEFEQLAMQGDFESLATAAGLYRGEFLEGISIRDAASQDWLEGERARFKRQFVEILANLGETQLISHDFSAAIKSTERLVEQDPLGESGWRLLMRSYADSGDRSHALQAFKRCQKSIRDELDVDPETATVELRDQIAGGKSRPGPAPADKPASPIDTPAGSSPDDVEALADVTTTSDHSIAVLPFDNLSGDPEQEYFSDGITDSIILHLAMFPGLQVKSRNSSFAFKQQIKSLGEISQELKVDYVVEGSIRKSLDRVRITVQLIETTNGNQVWGKRYDAGIEDLFQLEEELSRTIAATVTGQIETDLRRIAIAKGAAGQESYDLLLSGIYHTYRFNRQDTVLAIEKLNQCLAQDPQNVRAHVMLYTCHSMGALERWTQDHQDSFRQAENHIRKALALVPESGLVQVAFGEFLTFKGELKEGAIYLDKALELNPNDPDALTTKALNLELQSKFEASLELAQQAIGLDPYHPWAEWELAVAQHFCGHYETALETIAGSRTSPGFIQVFVVVCNIKLGRVDTARQALQNFLRECRENMLSMPQALDEWFIYTRENYQYADPRHNQEILDCLVQAGLEDHLSAPAGPGQSEAHRIAVLPFDNLSGDPAQEYFSDGITESIILNLSLFPGLNVKSRNSSFAFKQQIKSPSEISKELEVDYLVEGSIRKTDDRVRVAVQLVDATSGNQVWGKRYDAEIENLFDLEEELSRTIAATVTGQIESDLQRIAIAKGADNQNAYDLLLDGIYHSHKFTRPATIIAIEKLNRCIENDPGNVRAHVSLVTCHLLNYLKRWVVDFRDSFEQAGAHAHKALSLDPDNSSVQSIFAEYLVFCGRAEEALAHADQAIRLNPNDPDTVTMKAFALEMLGDFEQALELAELGHQLNPYVIWADWNLAECQIFSGRYEQALQTITQSKNEELLGMYYVVVSIKLDRRDQARRALTVYLQQCRDSMLSMPVNQAEWLEYSKSYTPFLDSSFNEDIIDCLMQAGLEDHLSAPANPGQSDAHSIAVLPFDNLSGDPEQEYFSDGITDSIILNLSRFPGLQVKSRNSSFAFKQQIKNLGEISRELNVDYVVEGSIRKSDDRIRITVQLIEAASGNQVWGKRYDAEIENLFDLEEELSRTIATTVTGQIESDLQRIAIAKGAAHQKAYDLLLQGIYHCKLSTPQDCAIAIEKLNQCLALDASNALAHAALYACHEMNWIDRWVLDFEASRKLCKVHASKALELNPDLGQVQVAYAEYLIFSRDYDEAEAHLKKALGINPNDSEAIAALALNLSSQGKFEAALEQARLAIRLDPYHTWVRWILTEAQIFCGQYEEALATIAETGNPPGFLQIHKIVANIHLNRMDVAQETLKIFLQNCRNTMLSMPRNIDEWLAYSRDNSPFADPAINQEIVDYLVQAGLEDELNSQQAQTDPEQQPSILVLPFNNMSGDPEQEYFSDGITESIILNLGTVNGLMVKSIHASFAFKDSARSFDEIAVELGVQYIVEGSIRKFGDKIRITAQLVDTASGNQVWGKRFDRDLEDLFALEEEISLIIAGTVSGRIDKEAQQLAMRKPARDMKSYDYFLRAIHHLSQFNAKDIKTGIELFEKCLALDTDNAEAHASLGSGYLVQLFENCAEDRTRTREFMQQHLERALELDPDNAGIHAFMAEALLYLKDFERGGAHARKAVELNPTLPDGYAMIAQYSVANRQYDQATQNTDQSIQIDPFHPYIGWNAGEIYRATENYERAIETFRALPHLPVSVHAQIAACLAGLDRIDEAREEMREYLKLAREQMISMPSNKDEWYSFWEETMPYKFKEDSDRYFDLLMQAGLCDQAEIEIDNMPSIAVLPFENMSGDPEQEYFSDGITASVILRLGLFNGITVKSQNSSFAYKNIGKSSEIIADELKVTYLVEGSIRKSAHKIRLSVQLIESASGNQIWGKQYDAELEDILELEQELSQTIAGTISGRIGHTLQQSAVRKPAKDPQSYDYLLRGLYYFGKFTASDFAKARHEIGKCLEIDPENATAHTNLGELLWVEILEGWTDDRVNSDRLSRFHLETAIEIEPDNALAHSYFGEYLFFKKDYEQSEFHIDKAIELNPTAAEGYVVKADLLGLTRRIDDAIPYAEKALQLDPHSIGAGWAAGGVFQNAGQFEKAIKIYRSIPHPPASIHASIAACISALGLDVEARREMKRYQELAKRDMPNYPADKSAWRNLWQTYLAYQYKEDFEAAFEQLIEAGLLEDLSGNSDEAPSIAVLPFENMSGDPEQEHFSDGITTDIIATLSRFDHMRTVSRYSVLQYKNQHASILDIAQQQNVRYILEGSVRKSGNSIRVSAELIDSQDEKICWSERYDRDLDDLFAVQDEITKNIALAMKVQLDDGDMALHRSTGTSNIKAWQLTLAAIDLQDTYIRENILEARRMAKQAIDLDPDYPYAWVALGWTHWQEVYSGWSDSPEDSLAEAEKAQQKALDLVPQYSEAWSLGGLIHLMRHKPTQALEYCRKAVELEPGNAEIQALMAFCLIYLGDYDNARLHEQNMQKLCPVLPNWYFLIGGEIAQIQGNFEQAATCFQQGIEVEPNSPLCRFYLIDVMMELGNEPRARALADEIRALDNKVAGKGLVRTVSQDKAMRKRFQANLEKFDLY